MRISKQDAIRGCHMMRDGALEHLTDADLPFTPGGDVPSLGSLFVALGEIQQGYITSFKTLTHDWTVKNDDPIRETQVAALQAWFVDLDVQMMPLINGLSEGDLQKDIDRGNGVIRSVEAQIDIYSQTMLIFLGKLVIYFQTMQKPLPPSIQHYIA
jgi:hypothetical protein